MFMKQILVEGDQQKMNSTLVQTVRNRIATKLDDLNQHDEQGHGEQHHVRLKSVIAVADRQVSDAAAAYDPSHRGVRQEADSEHSEGQHQARSRFTQKNPTHNLVARRTHGFGRLDDAAWNLAQALFNQACKVWNGRNGKRY